MEVCPNEHLLASFFSFVQLSFCLLSVCRKTINISVVCVSSEKGLPPGESFLFRQVFFPNICPIRTRHIFLIPGVFSREGDCNLPRKSERLLTYHGDFPLERDAPAVQTNQP